MSILERKIESESDLQTWKTSKSHFRIERVLNMLDNSVKSKKRRTNPNPSSSIQNILNVFDMVQKYLDDTPPVSQAAPFSNKGFVNFYQKLFDNRKTIFKNLTDNEEAIEYFLYSFGNPIRVDLGTGNELYFLVFITCLYELRIVSMNSIDNLDQKNIENSDDCEDLVFLVFWRYWDMLISIQRKYRLSPAGTHGSWGVDDFVTLPFVFGSSQLIKSDSSITEIEILPSNVIDRDISTKFQDVYAYCKWICYLYESKTGPFSQHSRVLYSLSSISSFDQIHTGMLKMFKAEVLDKFVVVQQFKFGSLIQCDDKK